MSGGEMAGTADILAMLTDERPRYPTRSTREQRVEIVKRAVLSNLETWKIKRQVKEEILGQDPATRGAPEAWEGSKAVGEVEAILESAGLAFKLKNLIYAAHRSALNAPPAPPEGLTRAQTFAADPLDFVERAKLKWEKRIRQELDAMAAELAVPLQRPRRGEENVKPPAEDQPIRFVYDDNDLLDVLLSISSPNHVTPGIKLPAWGLIKPQLPVRDLAQLRVIFAEVAGVQRQLGFDDELRPHLVENRTRQLQRAVELGYVPLLRQLAKRGIPQSLRPLVWRTMLGINVGEPEEQYLEGLHQALRKWELVTDELYRLDVTITSSDDNYFVFEDMLADTMSALSRDPWLVNNAAVFSQANDKYYADPAEREAAVFPPCGIVPFRGIVMYATPFCYLFSDTTELYYVFRACYASYCCRLHTVSSNPEDILGLGRQLEGILQETHAELFFHLSAIGAPPLRLAFNWLVFVFAGYLEVDQVLAVWDRILAFDSLLIVPVIAAAIFAFREKRLMECTTLEEVQDVLAEASKLKVMLLLQLYLFGDSPDPAPLARTRTT